MKLTKEALQTIIKEELEGIFKEDLWLDKLTKAKSKLGGLPNEDDESEPSEEDSPEVEAPAPTNPQARKMHRIRRTHNQPKFGGIGMEE